MDQETETAGRTGEQEAGQKGELAQVALMGDEPGGAPSLAGRGLERPPERDRAALLALEPGQRPEERRLSRVALAQDHVHGTGHHLEVEIPRDPARAVRHGESLHPETPAAGCGNDTLLAPPSRVRGSRASLLRIRCGAPRACHALPAHHAPLPDLITHPRSWFPHAPRCPRGSFRAR